MKPRQCSGARCLLRADAGLLFAGRSSPLSTCLRLDFTGGSGEQEERGLVFFSCDSEPYKATCCSHTCTPVDILGDTSQCAFLELSHNTVTLMVISGFWAPLLSSFPSQSGLRFIDSIAKKAFTTLWGHGPWEASGETYRCFLSIRFLKGIELPVVNMHV